MFVGELELECGNRREWTQKLCEQAGVEHTRIAGMGNNGQKSSGSKIKKTVPCRALVYVCICTIIEITISEPFLQNSRFIGYQVSITFLTTVSGIVHELF